MGPSPELQRWEPQKLEEAEMGPSPTASTMTYQGTGCGDHLCEKKACSECVDDRFKPLDEFESLEMLDSDTINRFSKLGWSLGKGSPIEFHDEYGESLLHVAAREGDIQSLEKLLEMGAPVNACCEGNCCCSPLMVACRWCQHDCVRCLLENGADIKQVNSLGECAMDKACCTLNGCEQDVEQLHALLSGCKCK